MSHFSSPSQHYSSGSGWFARTEDWIDSYGKTGWIVTLVVTMIAFWPIGLAVLAFILMRNKLGSSSGGTGYSCRRTQRYGATGNSAFDAYRADTIRRLEDEQRSFEDFLARLRAARDKAEFDQFMDDRAHNAPDTDDDSQGAPRPA